VKRRALVRKIAARAHEVGVDWSVKREGANHTVYQLGALTIPVPRHNEIGEKLAVEIFKQCMSELGEAWWK
jgi:N-acetylglucosamine kinase-like BadF-type ATPase